MSAEKALESAKALESPLSGDGFMNGARRGGDVRGRTIDTPSARRLQVVVQSSPLPACAAARPVHDCAAVSAPISNSEL